VEIYKTSLITGHNGRLAEPEHPCCPPPLVRRAWRLGGLGDLAGANAGRANPKGLPGAVDHGMNLAKIGIPPAPSDVVSMAHSISVNGTFTAYFADTRH